jgi:ATP-dependent DNA helicase RecG
MPTDWGFQPVIGRLPQISQTRAMRTPFHEEAGAHLRAAGPMAMLARYDRAMQSGPRRAATAGRRAGPPPRTVSPERLDLPLRVALPELGSGLSTLTRLGIRTPREALLYLPFRYDDFSNLRQLADLVPGEKQSARVRVDDLKSEPGFGRRPPRTIAQLSDSTGSAEAIWFGRRFIDRRLRAGDEIVISGKVTAQGWRMQFANPEFSPATRESVHTARVVPVYRLVSGVTLRRVRELLARVLDRCLPAVVDPLRPGERVGLVDLPVALRTAHFPDDMEDLRPALDRLAFDELLTLQLTLAQAAAARLERRAPSIAVPDTTRGEIVAALPFELTADQATAVDELLADLDSDEPMRRLLQGDVGSGKTAVAAIGLAVACRAGWQGALMAPTEILARQHHDGLEPLLRALEVRVEFLSGSLRAADKRAVQRRLAAGEVDVVVGTHAVISEAVTFERLGLAVVDEQHRFGVAQRGALQAKAGELEPHMLALTATPIPRTLALTVYGDLAISTLRHPPPGRLPIRTEIRDRSALPKIEAFIADEAHAGHQTFVVAPLVVESDALSAASAEAEAERLRASLPDLSVDLVHGQQQAAVREAAMQRFVAGETDVLVATTVIEVGIDVTNATVMVIEDAERFGLAQLHQLRGRVGRGAHRSFCILVSDATDELARRRLEVVRGSIDGFDIAEADLLLRGAGNVLGTRQSGLPPLRVASLFDPRHLELAGQARVLARSLVAEDPTLAGRSELVREQRAFTVPDAEGDAA